MSNVTLEELKKLLEEVEKGEIAPPISYRKFNIKRFIDEFKIKDGDVFYPNYIIYYIYVVFVKSRGMRKWGREEFFRNFSKMFKSRRTGQDRGYLLNKFIVIDETLYLRAKRNKSRQGKKSEKAKKKKNSEVSSVE